MPSENWRSRSLSDPLTPELSGVTTDKFRVFGGRGSTVPPRSRLSPPNPVRDWVGPPDRTSNLRPVIPYISPNESDLERSLRHLRMDTQDWNQKFWSMHNKSYVRVGHFCSEVLLRWSCGGHCNTLSADEMGEFFKLFLDFTKTILRLHIIL
uniref:Cytochrome c oxidase assembly factor 8 n=1 Tax=Eptatretus burgeri TaxID=7764 RepID=A0A8C4QXL9_EPTBU